MKNQFIGILIILSIGIQASPNSLCRELFSGESSLEFSPMSLSHLENFKEDGPKYFDGTISQMEEHADKMYYFGRKYVEELLQRYQSIIPKGKVILELGPYLNPIGHNYINQHPWLVWEYDTYAASKILKSYKNTTVFNVDLNQISENNWELFLNANFRAISDKNKSQEEFGAVILSSVINYIDYQKVLDHIIENMTDEGIIFIGNSTHGDRDFMKGRVPPKGMQIIEYLFLKYPNRIELLPEAKIFIGLDEESSKIKAAVRIHKKVSPKLEKTDFYALGIELYVDSIRAPLNANRVPNDNFSDKTIKENEIWFSLDPVYTQSSQLSFNGKNRVNRRSAIRFEIEETEKLKQMVLSMDSDNPKLLSQKRMHLENPKDDRFLPEREIFLKALSLDLNDRKAYIDLELEKLYRTLNHEIH